MSLAKHQSITSDTRLADSINQSMVGKSQMAKQLARSENCEVEFLRQKNSQLQERMNRMTAHVADLQKNKVELLNLNQKYVRVVNEYYRRGKSSSKENRSSIGNSILAALEKDHRNLVKHCLNMESQIKNYSQQMKLFTRMKEDLLTVNHTDVKEIIDQLRCLTDENRMLKKENNRLSYELEKSKQECIRLKKGKKQWQDKADEDGDEVQRYKSLINTIQQECSDKSNTYQSKIYELEIKVEKLEGQLRREQEYLAKTTDLRRKLEIAEVDRVHDTIRLGGSFKSKPKQRRNLAMSFYQ